MVWYFLEWSISHSGYFFGRFRFFRFFLFVASFASKCKLLSKDQSDFYHKDLVRVYQKQNLALSLFKPATTLSSKYECWCEFEKDLELLPLRKILRICMGGSFLIELPSPSTRASVFYVLRMNVFPNLHRHLNFVVEGLMVLSNVKAWTQWSIVRSKFTSFLALRLLLAIC